MTVTYYFISYIQGIHMNSYEVLSTQMSAHIIFEMKDFCKIRETK